MNKKFTKVLSVVLISFLTLSFITIPVFAYTSTLSISPNSTATGKGRSYTSGENRISIKLTSIVYPESGNKVKITLQKRTLGVYGTVGSRVSGNMKTIGKTYTYSFGQQSSGTYRYKFETSPNAVGASYVNGFYSEKVTMKTL